MLGMKEDKFAPEYLQVPYQLIQDENIKPADYIVYGVIYWLHSLKQGECRASNKFIAEHTGLTKGTVKNSLTRLENGGFIERLYSDDSRKNRLQIIPMVRLVRVASSKESSENASESSHNDTPRHQRMTPPSSENAQIIKESNNKRVNNKTTTNVVEAKPKKKSYGNEDINWVMETFEKHFGIPSQGRQKKDRYTAKHLLNNFTREQIEGMMLWVNQDEFAPRVGSVEKLWYKRGDIIAGIKKTQQKQSSNQIVSI